MLRWIVTWFKKPGPLTTSYTSFSAWNIEDAWRQTYESQEQVDVMMVEWQKQTITKWSSTISESYMAWWEWFDMWGSYWMGEVLIVFQTNANADLLAYVIKSRDELWDDWYRYRDAFMWGMTDAIWNTMQWWFSTTLIVTTSSWTITISDGSQSVLVNASNHNMRYNVDYYDWTSNTATEYTTLQTNWWLQDGTYTYQWANQDWNDIVDSLKAKGIVNATITHDTVNGEITMTNGPWSITIADKNVGATQVYNDGDTISETNWWKFYQWWNNYWFPLTWTVQNTTSTKIDTTGYWPGNYYSSDLLCITKNTCRDDPVNYNLRWDITDTEFARQWPCSSWYHIPSKEELDAFVKMYIVIKWNSDDIFSDFFIPKTWCRLGQTVYNPWYRTRRRSTTRRDATAYQIWIESGVWIEQGKAVAIYDNNALTIRPFKNTVTS